jgi:hypothetical protein
MPMSLLKLPCLSLLLLGAAFLPSCVKEISSDDRLDRDTLREETRKGDKAVELGNQKCDDAPAEFARAQDEKRSEEERLNAYGELFARLKTRAQTFDEAMSRNPDLAYQEGSQDLLAARDFCVQMSADAKLGLETLIREIMLMLVVDDVRGSQPIKVARLNYQVLRTAVDRLDADDRDVLMQRIAAAEKQVEVKPDAKKRGRDREKDK